MKERNKNKNEKSFVDVKSVFFSVKRVQWFHGNVGYEKYWTKEGKI